MGGHGPRQPSPGLRIRPGLAQRHKASTQVAQLLEVAGDTAGAFVLVPQGQRPAATQVGLHPRYLQSLALDLAARVHAAMDRAVAEISPDLAHGGRVSAEKLMRMVRSTTKRAATRIGA